MPGLSALWTVPHRLWGGRIKWHLLAMATRTRPTPADGSGLWTACNAAGSQCVSLSRFCFFIDRGPNNSPQIRFCTLISENQNNESASYTAFQILLLASPLTGLWGKSDVLILRGGRMKIGALLASYSIGEIESLILPFSCDGIELRISVLSVRLCNLLKRKLSFWKKTYSYHVLIN